MRAYNRGIRAMKRMTVQMFSLVIIIILGIMIFNDFSLHLVETLEIEEINPFYDFFWGFESLEAHNDFWTIYWGVASFLIVILAVLLLTDYLGIWSRRTYYM
jgi:hypothetical protein